MIGFGVTSIVAPSASAFFTLSAAMRPPAPGLFSTITLCAYSPFRASATRRATMSGAPPGGKPTTTRPGRAMTAARDAPPAVAQKAAAADRASRWRRETMAMLR
jgi:hypothetical protein